MLDSRNKKSSIIEKKEINLQSRNHSYLNLQEQIKTISKDGKNLLSNNSYIKLGINELKNYSANNKNSDSYRFANSTEKSNEKDRKYAKNNDLSKFKAQQNYTNIYNNYGNFSGIIDNNINHTNNKSRNANNNDKIPSSHSVNILKNNNLVKSKLTKNIPQRTFNNLENKSTYVINFTNTKNNLKDVKTNFLVDNYLNNKFSLKKETALKRPETVSCKRNISTKKLLTIR